MIKLERANCPSYLSAEKTLELTNEFKNSGKPVWNHDQIKQSLLSSSNGKCAYCECSLETESNYMEVEHFEDKSNNPDKVVAWENLLPSCKKCNVYKGTHNVLKDPIVNPYVDDPREHLAFRNFRLRGITAIGSNTIEVTNLNHSERLVFSRFKIGEKIIELIEVSFERWNSFQEKKDIKTKNKLVGGVEGLLKECSATSIYSATAATVVFTDKKFIELIEKMRSTSIWNNELEESFEAAKSLVLKCV